jgi:Spy/CpxP family protein refolding chaperone
MTSQDQKIKDLKEATKRLRARQEDLREARARYNMAVTALVDGDT